MKCYLAVVGTILTVLNCAYQLTYIPYFLLSQSHLLAVEICG